ncbi:MAG: type I-E CRISPR-associated endoribonuclease Cas2e [Planctomycetota bacterium]|nr:type I-E CRISPR-associated endoribonuclease Cas2e [Planctomycetota bacterium]
MILKSVPASLRGALSRWLVEPETGLFLGNPTARIRDELWKLAVAKAGGRGRVIQIWNYPCPQGYKYRGWGAGVTGRRFVNMEGLALVRRKRQRKKRQASDAAPGDR